MKRNIRIVNEAKMHKYINPEFPQSAIESPVEGFLLFFYY